MRPGGLLYIFVSPRVGDGRETYYSILQLSWASWASWLSVGLHSMTIPFGFW